MASNGYDPNKSYDHNVKDELEALNAADKWFQAHPEMRGEGPRAS